MKKIFKYKVYKKVHGQFERQFCKEEIEDHSVCYINAPHNAKIIRRDYVKDSQYEGNFVWCIVDTEDENEWQEIEFRKTLKNDWHERSFFPFDELGCHRLSVKEEQRFTHYGDIVGCADHNNDGNMYIYTNMHEFSQEGEVKTSTIVAYKTGQEIIHDVEKMMYLGLCRLWIVQELGLYMFKIENKKAL